MECYDWSKWSEQAKRRKRARRWPLVREVLAVLLTAGIAAGALYLLAGCRYDALVAVHYHAAPQTVTSRPATSQPGPLDVTPRDELQRLWRSDTWER